MTSQRRKLLVLVALVGLWALIFGLRPPAGRPARPTAGGGAPRAAAPVQALPRLKVELLDLPRPPYPAEAHNIFGTPPPSRTPAPPAPPPAQPAERVDAPPPAPPPDPFVEEAKQLRFVGYLRSGDGLTAFISRGQEIHSLDVGATLHGRYRIQAVTETEVVLASPQGDKRVRLPIAPAGGTSAPPAAPHRGPAGPAVGGAPGGR